MTWFRSSSSGDRREAIRKEALRRLRMTVREMNDHGIVPPEAFLALLDRAAPPRPQNPRHFPF